ncbi:DNA replication licensing factor MCM3 [Echinococcus granulosus]|uniref:DNA replication licensing factor MCM3 n=1 Tax=Echinococcus granulosus TaxID=6210 RepID=W6UPB0_ECHGR|nr:DNA replication licensing factor MCM3 [Echinococcus granulosus]EUB63480.1 DNA replication licensing factor MCM3 [Echinococcus granulosus]
MNYAEDQSLIESEREFVEFLDESDFYRGRLVNMISDGKSRLIISVNDLRRENPKRTEQLISNAFAELLACQRALKICVQNINPDYAHRNSDFFVGFEGSFGSMHVSPRTLTSALLGHMVCVEGIVTRASIVRPKITCSVHYCSVTKKTIERRYADMSSLDAFPSAGAYPTKDENGNLLETEYGLSTYHDHQKITIQEMPETAPAGQLPRSVDVLLDNDLVDSCKAGDRIQVVGQFRCLPGKKNGYTSASFRTALIANNVQLFSQQSEPNFSDKDIGMMRLISKRHDIVDLLARSLAPSIYGHRYIKKAILYLLLGGVERILPNGSRIRGDINVLLLGDPSVAKSQFLRFVLHVANLAIPTTGRGSSGVGLTAAITTDHETGERQLEAGAMVLADRGIVCIDEFDKMSDIDRTAIHEVMEQGRVTIAKAGIQAQLNARCSVLGAANPVYGRYDQYKTPMENIGLQDSLLSRFDLLFLVLDKADPEGDRGIAEHVLQAHQYRTPGEQEGEAMPLQDITVHLATCNMDPNMVGGAAGIDAEEHRKDSADQVFEDQGGVISSGRSLKNTECFTISFLKKYVHIARQLRPQLSKEAATIISEKYCDLRMQQDAENSTLRRTQPVTARTLETLIRLATANAKARMSKTVTRIDAEAAVELISFVLFKEVLEKSRRKRPHTTEGDGGSGSGLDTGSNEETENTIHRPRKRAATAEVESRAFESTSGGSGGDACAFDEARCGKLGLSGIKLPESRLRMLSTLVSRAFQERRVEQLAIPEARLSLPSLWCKPQSSRALKLWLDWTRYTTATVSWLQTMMSG